MQTIIYQGRPVQATLVNYLSGTIPTSTVDADGDEELFRDEAGRYYLRRKLGLLADYHEDNGEGNIEASGRTYVHRLSINAAILWATTRLNSETLALRCDAANLIMENRGYHDPHPVHLDAAKRNGQPAGSGELVCQVDGPVSGATGKGWFDGCIQPEEGSGARVRTIYDLDPIHAALLKLFNERHGINVAVLARAALVQQLEFMYDGRSDDEEEEAVRCLRQFGRLGSPAHKDELACMEAVASVAEEKGGRLEATPGRIVVELDDLASAMLRRVCREGSDCREAGEDPRDLVNAAVTFYLSDNTTARSGKFNLEDGGNALERAKTDRLAREKETA